MSVKEIINLFLLNLFSIPEEKTFVYIDVNDRINEINKKSYNMTSSIFKKTCLQLNNKYGIEYEN